MATTDLLPPDWIGYIPRSQANSPLGLVGYDWEGYPKASSAGNAQRVLPSFGTAGIPRPTVFSPTSGTGTATGAAPAAGVGGVGTVGTANPFTTLANTKNPAIDQRIADVLKIFDTVKSSTPEDFIARLKAAAPQFTQFTGEDIGTVGKLNTELPGALDTIRKSRHAAVRAASDRALGDLTKILNLGRQGQSQGGSGTVGVGSYLAKMGLDKASEIETGAALDEADQQRKDLEYQNTLQLGALGKRGALLDTDVNRSLLPSQANASWFNQLMQSLLPIVSASGANNLYGVMSPDGFVANDYTGVQAAKLGDMNRLQQANQFDIKSAQDAINANRAYSNTLFDNQLNRENSDNANTLKEYQTQTDRLRTLLGLG